MKALIKVGYKCNQRCIFCHNGRRMASGSPEHCPDSAADDSPCTHLSPLIPASDDLREEGEDRVIKKIRLAAESGHSMAVFSGGEPLLYRKILHWCHYAQKLGLHTGFVTNGYSLDSAERVNLFMDPGLEYVYLSLHGGCAGIHNAITSSDSFEHSLEAIKNLHGRIPDLIVNCVICRQNLDHLLELADLLSEFHGLRLKFSAIEPRGAALDSPGIIPDIMETAEAFIKLSLYAESAYPHMKILHDGIPLCLVPGKETFFDDLWTNDFSCMSEGWENTFYPVDNENKFHPEICHQCGLMGSCPGIFKNYNSSSSALKLRPAKIPRSNSFNLVPVKSFTWKQNFPCPVKQFSGFLDPALNVYIRNGERITLMRTKTRDFTRSELLKIKYGYGQLYVDKSKNSPVASHSDLAGLKQLEICNQCDEKNKCIRCFRVTDKKSDDDESILRDHISKMRGLILDIGCGMIPFRDILQSHAEKGLIRYIGVDPDAVQISKKTGLPIMKDFEWAEEDNRIFLVNASAEDIIPPESSVDHVLMLRSFNHLVSPETVLPRMADSLKKGGSILLADNVGFGLIRKPARAQRAETEDKNLEHYRNSDSSLPLAILSSTPLKTAFIRDVSPDTSNLWILLFRLP